MNRLEAADVDALHERLLAFAMRRVPSREIAEDLVQETWCAAWAGRERFEGRASLETWLCGILRRKIADHFRGRRVQVELGEPEASLPEIDRALDARRALDRLAAALDRLSARDRTLLLADATDVTRADLAARFGMSDETLRVAVFRSRAKARELVRAA